MLILLVLSIFLGASETALGEPVLSPLAPSSDVVVQGVSSQDPGSGVLVSQEDFTSSAPLHLKQFESLADLMQQMDMMHERTDDRNLLLALKGAQEVNRLNRGSLDPSVGIDDGAYRAFAEGLWKSNQALQRALESRNLRKIDRAFQAQSRSCRDCHRQFRPDD